MDQYLQQHVRIENLKEGEARKIVSFLDEVHQDLILKLENTKGDWSRTRYTSMIQTYEQALDSVYAKSIMPALDADGLEFVAKNQAFHYEALMEGATGQTKTQRMALAAKDYDLKTPWYRGSSIHETKGAGLWFSADPLYASNAAIGDELESLADFAGFKLDQHVKAANVGKFYMPKDGLMDISEDQKLRGEFIEWIGKKYNLESDSMELDDLIYRIFDNNLDQPHWSYEDDVVKFLNEKRAGWKTTYFAEEPDDYGKSLKSVRASEYDVGKSAYSNFDQKLPAPVQAVANQNVGGAIVTTNLSPQAIYTAATSEPMQGKLMTEWATQLSRKEKGLVSSSLRQAWIEGESISRSAERISRVTAGSRRDLAAITRTYYGHLAAETRDAVWDENSDIVEGITWDSILDGRTTTDICGPRDQKKYSLKGEPIDHNLSYMGGPGQAHWNCRSMSFPSITGVKPKVQRQAVGAGANYTRGDNVTRTGKVRTNSARNRKSGILKETTVSQATDYEKWLGNQPKAFQEDVLGVAKAKAFRSGDWKLGTKFTPQNPITIDQF